MNDYIKNSFQLQDVSSKILDLYVTPPNGHSHRISHCTKMYREDQSQKGGPVIKENSTGNPYYSGLQTCSSVWICPVCAKKITEVRRQEIEKAVESHKNGSIFMVTFTIPHYIQDSLKSSYDLLLDCRRIMKGQKKVKNLKNRFLKESFEEIAEKFDFLGDIASIEITYSDNSGFHPHCHSLFFFNRFLTVQERAEFENLMRFAWCDALLYRKKLEYKKSFDFLFVRGLKVDEIKNLADYVTKAEIKDKSFSEIQKIVECYKNRWKYSDELTKSHSKNGRMQSLTPFDFLRIIRMTKDTNIFKKFSALFCEYYQATFGKRQIFWGKCFKSKVGMKQHFKINSLSDEEITQGVEQEKDKYIGHLDHNDWVYIRRWCLRGDFLQWIKDYDFETAMKKLREHIYEKPKERKKTYKGGEGKQRTYTQIRERRQFICECQCAC
jgi:hypothetical protein